MRKSILISNRKSAAESGYGFTSEDGADSLKKKTRNGILHYGFSKFGAEGRTRPIDRESIGTRFSAPEGRGTGRYRVHRTGLPVPVQLNTKKTALTQPIRFFEYGAEGRTRPIDRKSIGTRFSAPAGRGTGRYRSPPHGEPVPVRLKENPHLNPDTGFLFKDGAEGRTRTGTGCPTTPSR